MAAATEALTTVVAGGLPKQLASIKAPFRVGRKGIYLPNLTITLVRTPFLPPTFARFVVPLTTNKLDLRDYLWHAYGVRALAVRSYVHQQAVRKVDPDARVARFRWHRPRAIKKMTVEMDRPFVWPAEPTDFAPWDKDDFDDAEAARERRTADPRVTEATADDSPYSITSNRIPIAQQARDLLRRGRRKVARERDGIPLSELFREMGGGGTDETSEKVTEVEKGLVVDHEKGV